MGKISIPRTTRHHNAPGKSLAPTLLVGTRVVVMDRFPGEIVQVRKKKKFACRYLVDWGGAVGPEWMRRDEFTLGGGLQ